MDRYPLLCPVFTSREWEKSLELPQSSNFTSAVLILTKRKNNIEPKVLLHRTNFYHTNIRCRF